MMSILKKLRSRPAFGPVWRVSVGISGLVIALVFVLDMTLGVLPDENRQLAQVHAKIAEAVATQALVFLESKEPEKLQRTLDMMADRQADILSIGIRTTDGKLIASTRRHAEHWPQPSPQVSTVTHAILPVYRQKQRWADVEVAFEPQFARTWTVWLKRPDVALVLTFSTVGFLSIYFYLRRVMQNLDPLSAVPDRVRHALNTLSEGVLVLDTRGTIMLSNQTFRKLQPQEETLEGKSIASLQWLTAGFMKPEGESYPWTQAMKRKTTVHGVRFKITDTAGNEREALVNCSPITDGGKDVRGCLMSFDDVTALSEANAKLKNALNELAASRDQIQQQNEELQKLANVDPLTGCLNRRAFFGKGESVYNEARLKNTPLTCIMTDIDHFKKFNDTYGHAVGDMVLKQVAATLSINLRAEDMLCRYGGEEFCILLRNTDKATGMEIAERIRFRIEREVGAALVAVPGLKVTSSFGLVELRSGLSSLDEMIKAADLALYQAKHEGRNRLCVNTGGDTVMKNSPPAKPAAQPAQGGDGAATGNNRRSSSTQRA